ncbi:MAG: tRNA (adenosine(37)-N6)-threonylcarbamoyltransferase complex transferase subunit TsaD [Bacteroidales bacterium]|nr:tRNA (adenosine(37)-N6)-threonylcarbamoyltransferase complex transferase subunit TsaD [Bacteroidales bacterium]
MKKVTILAVESSCDDTSASVVSDGYVLSSIISTQKIHIPFGGVVPELASRAHMANIIPVVEAALKGSGTGMDEISAVAFTRGPGLMGSLLVGVSFAKGFALARDIPLIEVNHLQAHVLVHFIRRTENGSEIPPFPFLCLLVSGGHTQIIVANDYFDMEVLGTTIDDAAGEAFDKCGKVMGLPYPSGPVIDKIATAGNPEAFRFAKPSVANLDFSFSGLKTSFLYFLRDSLKENPSFIEENKPDLCASLQRSIVTILVEKMIMAAEETGIKNIGLAGGVSANSALREMFIREGKKRDWKVYIPDFRLTTDNAAMIGIAGYYRYLRGDFSSHAAGPSARFGF